LIDAIWEQIVDVRKAFFVAREKDNGTPGENQNKFWTSTFPDNAALLDKNVHGEGHFIGSKLSIADVAFYYLCWVFATENKFAVDAALGKHAKLKKVYDAVAEQPNIKKWVAERPQTIF